jgi:hypothetical protein
MWCACVWVFMSTCLCILNVDKQLQLDGTDSGYNEINYISLNMDFH